MDDAFLQVDMRGILMHETLVAHFWGAKTFDDKTFRIVEEQSIKCSLFKTVEKIRWLETMMDRKSEEVAVCVL